MADLFDLATFCNDFINRNQAAFLANSAAKGAALAIVEDLTLHTPADVGDALSGWQVSLDAPAPSDRPAFVPSPRGRMIAGVWTHRVPPDVTALANAPSVMAAARQVLGTKNPGQVIYITNNSEYIIELNNGTSQQEPGAFVERAEIAGQYYVDTYLNYVNSQRTTQVFP